MAKEEIVELLKKYFYLLRAEGISIDKAYLYGSYLSNTITEDSDIDVMIVTENEDDHLTCKVWSLTKTVNSNIEPYIIGKERFNRNDNSPLVYLVKRIGLEIA